MGVITGVTVAFAISFPTPHFNGPTLTQGAAQRPLALSRTVKKKKKGVVLTKRVKKNKRITYEHQRPCSSRKGIPCSCQILPSE
jgi:hypothetical protein